MGQTTSNTCKVDEISSKTRKNQLEFIWKIFASRSKWNKYHSIQISISWESIKNMFFTIKMKKLVSCSSKNWEKFIKTGFTQESLSKSHFSKILQVLLTLTNLLECKILEFSYNPHPSHKITQTFTLTLLLSISKAQLRKKNLRDWKWGFI